VKKEPVKPSETRVTVRVPIRTKQEMKRYCKENDLKMSQLFRKSWEAFKAVK